MVSTEWTPVHYHLSNSATCRLGVGGNPAFMCFHVTCNLLQPRDKHKDRPRGTSELLTVRLTYGLLPQGENGALMGKKASQKMDMYTQGNSVTLI